MIKELLEIFEELKKEGKIDEIQFRILKTRYISELKHYLKKRNTFSKFYNSSRFTVTFGSLIVPALLSIQNTDNILLKDITYWSTWVLSLLVTTCNGLIGLFTLDKNYIMYGLTLEKLKSEGWQFIELSGIYENFKTHNEAFTIFCKNLESIKIKQVHQQYSESKSKPNSKFNSKPIELKKSVNNELETVRGLLQQIPTKEDIENNIAKQSNYIKEEIQDSIVNKIQDSIVNKIRPISVVQNSFETISDTIQTMSDTIGTIPADSIGTIPADSMDKSSEVLKKPINIDLS